ncbi:NPCBM/NEW2 domain-containing protein [Botrimarina hoheduenensis]|uniref:NPCBM/NEW2 domain protein n=1 Tax=Botrimarina hoheduenensis TaxID=2528000 RepID=A0A5C5VWX0_9BACT|nr:NPCBM/NEW2 domain-containing protein [Botrimarina hoheduenensis]TWT42880.1 NPCBM/NEW2 domain protein [Botrimarina hoheduenensis]
MHYSSATLLSRLLTGIFLLPGCFVDRTEANAADNQARLIDGTVLEGRLSEFRFDADRPRDARVTFAPAGTASPLIPASDPGTLVRWGAPTRPDEGVWLCLQDGSLLAAEPGWAQPVPVKIDQQSVSLRRAETWIEVPRSAVRRVLLAGAPPIPSAANSQPLSADTAQLASVTAGVRGDVLSGSVASLDQGELAMEIAGTITKLQADQIASLELASSSDRSEATGPTCLVGLDDGSLLKADRIDLNEERLIAWLAAGTSLTTAAERVVFVQPIGGRVRYLSDSEPLDYRHTPYFDLAWPYGRDTGPRGEPLVARRKRSAKGLGTHSAMRLVYALNPEETRFQASLAVADGPEQIFSQGAEDPRGSVVFRVYAIRGGAPDELYESLTVRAGEPPREINLDVTGAVGLALVVDYADDGDTGDNALWLDARVVTAAGD